MPLRAELRRLSAAVGVVVCSTLHAAEPASAPAMPASAPAVTLGAVRAAADALAHDPLLHAERTERVLRWDFGEDKKERPKPEPTPEWLRGLADWLASAGRGLAWGLGGLAVALACVVGWRLWQRRMPLPPAEPAVPSHVGSLDIRPESLPEPLGPAAAALWRQGKARGALALLYRGALSRLVHRQRVPIIAASTEAECLALAAPRLSPEAHEALQRLIDAWLEIGYAHRRPDEAVVLALCEGFDGWLGSARAPAMPDAAVARRRAAA